MFKLALEILIFKAEAVVLRTSLGYLINLRIIGDRMVERDITSTKDFKAHIF